MKRKFLGNFLLLLTALIWGLAFVAQSVGMDYVGPFTFQFCRSLLATATLFLAVWLFDRRKKDGKTFLSRWQDKRLWVGGILCGVCLFAATSLQQIGLQYTTPGKSGFITAMYIVLVPLSGLFLGRRASGKTWLSVALAVGGLYLLCLADGRSLNRGDFYTLLCALVFTVQIDLVEYYSPKVDGIRLSFLQTAVTCVLSLIVMVLTETPRWSLISACAVPILYSGILSMAVAYTLQIIGQKHASNPALACLLMSLESVFAALFGWLILKKAMSPAELAGCALVFIAIILAQMPQKKDTKAQVH